MFFECLDGVFRAARMKPAIPSNQGTDCQPISAHKQNKQSFHWARRENNSSISPRKACLSGVPMRVETRTTISRCGKASRDRRKDSRTMRLIRFRLTAERTNFFAMTTPSLAVAIELGRWSISKCLPRRVLRKAKTDEKSSVLRNRCSSRKPKSTPAAATSNAETCASLGAASTNDSSSAACTHANKESMGAFAPNN